MCQALCIDCLIKFPQHAYKLGFNFFPLIKMEKISLKVSQLAKDVSWTPTQTSIFNVWAPLESFETQEIGTPRQLFQWPLEFMCFLFQPQVSSVMWAWRARTGVGERINFRCGYPHWGIFESGNGNPLLYSGLRNPKDRGAWWATVCGVTKSRTWLNWLCMQWVYNGRTVHRWKD